MPLHRVATVYLAGGMRTNWQDKVMEAVKGSVPAIFIDPRSHGQKTHLEYTSWDLEGVRRADIILAYLERDNPSGAGLALEIGFATALSEAPGAVRKKILFVCDPAFPLVRYFGMAKACSDAVYDTLDEGIAALHKELLIAFAPLK
jgi:nucleoside 2-deoxyribosyltransferase